jgi:hypothetical protein
MSLMALLVHRKGRDISGTTYSAHSYVRCAWAIRLRGPPVPAMPREPAPASGSGRYGAIGRYPGQRIEGRAWCWSVSTGRNTEEVLLFCVHRDLVLSQRLPMHLWANLTQGRSWRSLMAETTTQLYHTRPTLGDAWNCGQTGDPGSVRPQPGASHYGTA